VVKKWQEWNWKSDHAVTSLLTLHADGTVRIEGQFSPEPDDLPKLGEIVAPLLFAPSPISLQGMLVPVLTAARMTFGVDPTNPECAIRKHSDNQLFKSTSAVASEFIPDEGISLMKTMLESVPPLSAPPSQTSMIQLLGGGGKAGEPAPTDTAVYWRNAKCV